MAELPILPIKTDALLADTTHMSAEEFGVYCRLLFVMWRHGAKLKDDDGEMAIIGGITLKRWMTIKEKVMRPMTVAGGLVSQGRLTDTWLNVQELRRKRALASDIRWKTKRHPNGMQMHDHVESNRNATKTKTSKNTLLETEYEERVEGPGNGNLAASPELLATLSRRRP